MSNILRESQDSAPSSPEGDVESLVVSLTTSPRKLVQALRRLQAEKLSAEAHSHTLRRKLEDVERGAPDTAQPKSKRSRPAHSHDEAESGDDGANADSAERFVIQAGHKFCILCGPWVHSAAQLFQLDMDESYAPGVRTENMEMKSQAQLKEIWELLQSRFEFEDLKQTWVARAFMSGVNAQRSNTATRVRRYCASILGVDEADLMRSECRREKFRHRIGWVTDGRGNGCYSNVDVEILHKNYPGEYSPSSAFLNPILMGLFVAVIRGPNSGKEFMMGILSSPKTETIASIHHLCNITPGAIASIAVFARWALSADDILQPVGSNTGINYFADYEEYEWDKLVFPNTGTSLVGGSQSQESAGIKKAMALLDADESESASED
ncbi:hypothetical protein HYPSUDRAFT_209955 [Hypholoma sublateritium FD-334 SS-4]|uniref:Uncharacterized protein n=1 Tax=Hypholoma sublateritium (strain FD-334 SS-4) TaxID=945553 RepID=A0A0D2KEM2_HYPSF|nr:hypothetical protein HYPSUDRAFT_209955 [Hypholoma sublateritium FD-334 SS-4]